MENLIMALKNNRSPLSVLFYKYNKIDHNKVVNIASDIGLISVLDKLSGELSHGQKQWLEIGMLLAQEPQLLLIDEPAAGMTLEERKHTVLLLKRLSKTRAVVVVEHDMEFIRNLSCKVTVLHEGAVLAEGTLDHVVKNKTVIDVYLGR
jgi:urea transport system ATP-binding protein